jgi:hypothetical protein
MRRLVQVNRLRHSTLLCLAFAMLSALVVPCSFLLLLFLALNDDSDSATARLLATARTFARQLAHEYFSTLAPCRTGTKRAANFQSAMESTWKLP